MGSNLNVWFRVDIERRNKMLAMFWGQRYFIENLLFKYFTLSWKLSKNLDFFSHQIVLNGAENKIVSLHSAPSLQSHPSGNQNQKLWSEITLISVHLPTLQITHISQLREKISTDYPHWQINRTQKQKKIVDSHKSVDMKSLVCS